MKERLLIFAKNIRNTSPVFGFLLSIYKLIRGISYFLLRSFRKQKTRLLMIYDLSSQPFSIGDILVVQEASLVLREEFSCDLVDFAFVCDPKRPTTKDPAFSSITEENYIFHLASIMPVAQVNPHLGSSFLFNSHAQLERFVTDNVLHYHVWPSFNKYVLKTYMYHKVFNNIIADYFAKNKSIPHLSSRSNMIAWATDFFYMHVWPNVPVTVQLRRNLKNPARNSNYEIWLGFFAECQNKYPAKFIVICSDSEVDDRLRACVNVIIVKDYRTYIEQDLALINMAAIHLGAASGPGTMALFSDKPFLFVNSTPDSILNIGFKQYGNLLRADYSNNVQNFTVTPETLQELLEEFEKMWLTINVNKWKKEKPSQDNQNLYSWLR